jgi:sulfotransferase family protein
MTGQPGPNPYVFFVGCPRSGTTLVRRMGDAHPELAIIGELHWLPRWWERRIGITAEGIVTRELLRRLLAEPRFHKLGLAAERVADLMGEGRPKHYARFVTELFDLHGEVRGKRLVGEKTPGYVRHLETLNELWPHAKIIHLIRDGRDVALSLLDRTRSQRAAWRLPTWEEDPVTTAALYWEWNVRLGREAGARLGSERYHELSYESLVADSQRECERMCAFLRVPYDDAMVRFHEGRTRVEPGLSAKRAWRPITAGLRNWGDQMAPGDVVRFESAAGGLLEELGYERAAAHVPGKELASAARLRVEFVEHAAARRRRLPAEWGNQAS